MHRVIIVEDDCMVADINRKYVEDTPNFSVEKVFQNGIQALEYLQDHDVSLIILDYYMPMINGMEFVDRLHSMGKTPSIIMVTSSNDTQTVCGMFSRGIIDYLVKPFEYDRFRVALDRFRQTHGRLSNADSSLNQEEIDEIFSGNTDIVKSGPPQVLAKGLNESTLQMIRHFMRQNRTMSFTSEEIAEQVNLSRITVRRYMNYMVETKEITSAIDYHTGGRPSIKYKL